jgi:hypothetical protein
VYPKGSASSSASTVPLVTVSIVVVNSLSCHNARVIVCPATAPSVSLTVIEVAHATGDAVNVAVNPLATATGLSVATIFAFVKSIPNAPYLLTVLLDASYFTS